MQEEPNISNLPEIPDEFAEYAEIIKATVRKKIRIELKEDTNLAPWQSKVGGHPYLPLTEKLPCNPHGQHLMFLAQINFSETPHLAGFPEKGIVQFYIDGRDDMVGMDFGNPTSQKGFRVLYFDIIEEDKLKLHTDTTDLQFKKGQTHYGPFMEPCCYSMKFTIENQYMTSNDYRFASTMPFGDDDDMLVKYNDIIDRGGHFIGGYPNFTQFDPREDKETLKDYELLFQLNTDQHIMWGDAGVGGFFIHPGDLKKCDFAKVLYNWDCC